MNTTKINQSGFTLIELLIVILIIGILMALLMPAINYARESARAIQCTNNQSELAKAIITFEIHKKRLPGVIEPNPDWTPGNTPTYPFVNWVMVIFGELGRMDLWEDWRDGTGATPIVSQLICPSNPTAKVEGGLSYMVNLGGYYNNSSAVSGSTIVYTQRLFRNRAAWDSNLKSVEPDITLDALKSTTRTVMLSERLEVNDWCGIINASSTYSSVADTIINSGAAVISPATPYAGEITAASIWGFQWPYNGGYGTSSLGPRLYEPASPTTPPALTSHHNGNVIVTFCDGHVEKIPQDTHTWFDPENQIFGVPSP